MKRMVMMLMISLALVSCKKEKINGSGEVITETRTVNEYYNVSVNGSTDVFITKGNNFEVKVKAYENIIPHLETKVQNGTLLIGFKANSNVGNDNSEVYITMPNLNSVAVSGSSNVKSTGTFSGSGNFKATISGSGNIDLQAGAATNYKISISGSGSVRSFGFICEQAEVDIAGSGNAELTVTKNLNATIDGSGTVYYRGNPADVYTKITGSGGVVKQ